MNKFKTLTFASLIALGSTLTSAQQTAPESSMENTTQSDERNNDMDWGWTGLLGLAGLLGLKRKDREPTLRTANRPS